MEAGKWCSNCSSGSQFAEILSGTSLEVMFCRHNNYSHLGNKVIQATQLLCSTTAVRLLHVLHEGHISSNRVVNLLKLGATIIYSVKNLIIKSTTFLHLTA
jgi:hypothetical protein